VSGKKRAWRRARAAPARRESQRTAALRRLAVA
jgi:hypothetical protein